MEPDGTGKGIDHPPSAVRPKGGVTKSSPEHSSLDATAPPAMPAPAQAPNCRLEHACPCNGMEELNNLLPDGRLILI